MKSGGIQPEWKPGWVQLGGIQPEWEQGGMKLGGIQPEWNPRLIDTHRFLQREKNQLAGRPPENALRISLQHPTDNWACMYYSLPE